MLVSTSIMVFILLCAYGVLNLGNRIYINDKVLLEMEQQARNGLQRMEKEIRQASSHTIVSLGAGSDQLTFSIPSANNVMYYLTGTNLTREFPAGTKRTVASNIGRLQFSVNNKVMTIDIRADKTIYNRTVSFPLIQKVRLRNE